MGRSPSSSFTERGVIVSVASSVFFAGIYFVTPMLAPASAESIWGIRNLVTIPIIVLALLALRQWELIAQIWARIRKKPLLLLPILACGFLVAAQLWLFSWAPLNGRGLQVALGYFLLPLVLVVIGRVLYKDKLLWWHWLAAGIAAVGVTFEFVRVGTVSWETMLVAFGYPVYFVLRRSIDMNHIGGMFWEFLLFAPIALVLVIREMLNGYTLEANPSLYWFAPVFGAWTGVALVFYLLASRYLTISIFGLLSYLEPALLVVASILIGERIAAAEWPIYITVWLAVAVIVVGGAVQIARAAITRRGGEEGVDPPPSSPG